MFNFFIKPRSPFNYPIKKYYKFEYIKRKYNFEINKVKDYYRGKNRAVNNRHILNRIITMLAPSYTLEDFDYYSRVDSNSRLVSKQFDIVSNINKGRVLQNELYGENSDEIFLYTETPINLDTFKYTWITESPIRCIHTNNLELSFMFPYENITLPENSLHVFEIDITKMLMMYKYWCLERVREDNSTNPNVFIATIVLPNVLDSLIDLTIVNRYLAIAAGEKLPHKFINKHPFVIINYVEGIDNVLTDIVKDTRNSSIPLEQLLLSIPVIVEETALPVIKITHTYYTAQSKWVFYLSRVGTIKNLLTVIGKKGRARNKELVNTLPYVIKTILRRSGGLPDILTPDRIAKFNKDITTINKIIGKR